MKAYIAVIAALGLLSGCATIVKGTRQSVSVETTPVSGAKCQLQNSEGTWFISTPGSVVVHKTKNDLAVTCKKSGYADAATTITAHFNAVTFGNIIAGGLIGVGVDAASGANYTYAPTTIVDLDRLPAVDDASPPLM